jgi:signal transduction histidine kinase
VIDNIIYLYQLDHNPEPEPLTRVDACAFVQQMVQEAANTWEAKGVTISTRLPEGFQMFVPVRGLSLAVFHLLDNAFKFASKNGVVKVALEKSADQINIMIENDGQKIPLEKRKDIFDRFMQVSEGDARNFGGLGLGLAIVKAFAQSVRGSVEADESELGTRMRLTFPFVEDADRERLKQKLEMYYNSSKKKMVWI